MVLVNEENMPMFIRCGVNALVAAYLNFLSQMIANPPFCQHVSKVSHRPISTASCVHIVFELASVDTLTMLRFKPRTCFVSR